MPAAESQLPSAKAGRGQWWVRLAVLAAAALVGWRTAGVVGLALAVAGLGFGPLAYRTGQRRWALRHYDDELVRLLRAAARSLRSGATLRLAVVEAAGHARGPLADDMARLSDRLDDGVVRALEAWAAERPVPSVRLVAGGLALGYATGGITAQVVDTLADGIRLRLDVRDEAAALSTQAAVSAVVMAGVPLTFFALSALGDGASAGFLLHEPLGRACLAVGLVLDAASLAWMLHLVRAVER